MAVVQLSRIKHRRGPDADIDKVLLQESELGFTTDTGRVFIGGPKVNPNLPRKPKSPHNIEILTELSQVAPLTKYDYRNRDINNSEFPMDASNRASPDFKRYLQEKLDEVVSVGDYGANGDFNFETGEGTDNTHAIWKAAIDVTVMQQNKGLYFPAGAYLISQPALLPKNSTWIGEGKEKTFIVVTNPKASCVAHTAEIDALTLSDVDWENIGDFVGKNIKNVVDYISISGITFLFLGGENATNEDLAVLKLERSSKVMVHDCRLQGNWKCTETKGHFDEESSKYVRGEDILSVLIDGYGVDSKQFYFSNTEFKECSYAFYITDDNTSNIVLNETTLENLYSGIQLGRDYKYNGDPSLSKVTNGPRNFKVFNSYFHNIFDVCFAVVNAPDSCGHTSMNNIYDNYGLTACGQVDDGTNPPPEVAAIYVGNGVKGFTSFMDNFSYEDSATSAVAFVNDDKRIRYNVNDKHFIVNSYGTTVLPNAISAPGISVESNVASENENSFNITQTETEVEVATFDTNNATNLFVYYTIKTDLGNRSGKLIISYNNDDDFDWTDQSVDTNDLGVELDLDVRTSQTNQIELYVVCNSGSETSFTFKYQATYWNADAPENI